MTATHVLSRPQRTPVIGRRVWSVVPAGAAEGFAGPVLRGAHGQTWTGHTLTAECRPPLLARVTRGALALGEHPGPPPHPDCDCGIYALKAQLTPGDVLTDGPHIVGSVELTGVVLEGSRGYRAQEARIVGPLELQANCDVCGDAPVAFADLGLHYGLGCEWHSDGHRFNRLDLWLEQLEQRYPGPVINTSQWSMQ